MKTDVKDVSHTPTGEKDRDLEDNFEVMGIIWAPAFLLQAG